MKMKHFFNLKSRKQLTLILFSIIYVGVKLCLKFNIFTFEEIVIIFLIYIFIDTTSLVSEKDDEL